MDNLQWIFDGIGSQVVALLAGLFVGGGVGYKIGVRKQTLKQTQKAGDNSRQTQVGQAGDR